MCDITWEAVMDKIRDAMNKETPLMAKDIGSDGHERYACPVCGSWWYGRQNYCHECGHRMAYK